MHYVLEEVDIVGRGAGWQQQQKHIQLKVK